jgi:CheY-like chemotaxis protein
MGLGLSQVYGFISQSEGRVLIESEVREGTAVELLLPRADTLVTEEESRAIEGAMETSDPCHGEYVLVVEDESGVRQLVVEALEGLGYQVLSASDAAEAKVLLQLHPEIDLLFTDIVMPGTQNGLELAQEAIQRRPELPVLFTSGYSGRTVLRDWPGEIALLQKPYRIGALAQAVRACLDAARRLPRPKAAGNAP